MNDAGEPTGERHVAWRQLHPLGGRLCTQGVEFFVSSRMRLMCASIGVFLVDDVRVALSGYTSMRFLGVAGIVQTVCDATAPPPSWQA